MYTSSTMLHPMQCLLPYLVNTKDMVCTESALHQTNIPRDSICRALSVRNHQSLLPFATETSLPLKLGLRSEPCFLSLSSRRFCTATTTRTAILFSHNIVTFQLTARYIHGEHQECHWPGQWRATGPRAREWHYWCRYCW